LWRWKVRKGWKFEGPAKVRIVLKINLLRKRLKSARRKRNLSTAQQSDAQSLAMNHHGVWQRRDRRGEERGERMRKLLWVNRTCGRKFE
jgi:hypothetical protein